MRVKKYESSNLQDALTAVRKELGPDAVILQTKKYKKGGILGFFGQERVEVLAAVDASGARPSAPRQAQFDRTVRDRVPARSDRSPRPESSKEFSPQASVQKALAVDFQEQVDPLAVIQNDIHEMKSAIKGMARRSGVDIEPFPDPFGELYLLLLENEVEEYLAQEIIHAVHAQFSRNENFSAGDLKNALRDHIAKMVRIVPITEDDYEPLSRRPRCIAFVGPTGVGKTTTIAKIASDLVITRGRKVGLVSADTYRIAAVEQLRTYAEIIQIPIEIVYSQENAGEVLDRLSDMEIVLIDTAGRSPRNTDGIKELSEVLNAFRPVATHLVLAASTKRSDLLAVTRSFAPAQYDDLVFTKIDETLHFGSLLTIMEQTGKGVAYITDGQSVPEDIQSGDARHIARLILGEKRGGSG